MPAEAGLGTGGGPGTGRYAAAGVDIDAGERAVALMRAAVERAGRPEVIGGIGGFAGLFDASALTRMRRPLLATSTDGVGTKVMIAQRLGVYDTIGLDLVGMVVDDLVVCGAEPLFMTDYAVFGKVTPERVAAIVGGIAAGCVQAGCALIGGETAEHPGHLGPGDFDLAGAATGVVDADRLLGAERVGPGDVVIAMAASGLHSNGFSLVRSIIDAGGPAALDVAPAGLSRTLGEELLTPTRIYSRDCLALAAALPVRVFAHVTGGGLAANLARVLPPHADAVLDRRTWTPAPVFGFLARRGGVALADLEGVFNMGVGMAAIVAREATDAALALLAARDVPAWVLGEVTAGTGTARLTGAHRG
jgi:phosphoribosylformylglycinamidine cyclo-ligase